jgi:hypothetical protein
MFEPFVILRRNFVSMMLSIVSLIVGVTALTSASQISCGSPISNGTLWYSNVTQATYEGQIGVLEAYGNAELLAHYPNANVHALNLVTVPCTSSYLNATIPMISEWNNGADDIPVKLLLANDSSTCISLQFYGPGSANVFVTQGECSEEDDDTQEEQFWTQDTNGVLLPSWFGGNKSQAWNLQFNMYDEEEIIANPPDCDPATTFCQVTGPYYGFVIKE